MDINSHIWKTIEQIEGKVKPWWPAQAARFSNSERFVLGPSVKAAASHSLLQISVIPSNKGWNQAATLSMVPLFLAFSRQPIKTVHSTHGAWSMLRYIYKKKKHWWCWWQQQICRDNPSRHRNRSLTLGDLLQTKHIFWRYYGISAQFFFGSNRDPHVWRVAAVLHFHVQGKKTVSCWRYDLTESGIRFFSPPLYWSRRRRRRGSRLTCVGRSL